MSSDKERNFSIHTARFALLVDLASCPSSHPKAHAKQTMLVQLLSVVCVVANSSSLYEASAMHKCGHDVAGGVPTMCTIAHVRIPVAACTPNRSVATNAR